MGERRVSTTLRCWWHHRYGLSSRSAPVTPSLGTCPICGYEGLGEPARTESGGGSYEICSSCGFQFGVTDDDTGFSDAAWRWLWIAEGMPWTSVHLPLPDWDPGRQLSSVGAASERPPRPFALGASVVSKVPFSGWRIGAGAGGVVESARSDVPVYEVRIVDRPDSLLTLAHEDLEPSDEAGPPPSTAPGG